MKKISLSLLFLSVFFAAFSQQDFKKAPGLGIHYFFNDYKTASDIRQLGLPTVFSNKDYFKFNKMQPGIALSYLQGFSNHIDFVGTLSSSIGKYPVPDKPMTSEASFLFEAAATANLKLLTDKYYVVPFLTAGVGAAKYKGYYSAFAPLGVGVQIKLVENSFIILNSQYRVPITDNSEYHLYHSIGFAKTFPRAKVEVPVVVIPVVQDRDGDGVVDAEDRCPDVAGLASLQGCPDRDGDGIADIDDACPDVAGVAKYKGCPIPDTDGDGINDEMDKCPTVPGVARYGGCPIPDTDGDGVNDEMDKCPTRPGPASNQGCPEIAKEVIEKVSFAAKNIFFATGKYQLLAKSHKSLDGVVDLLKADESLMLDIDGHTDDVGSDESNQVLSDNRAGSVKEYFLSKGIDASRLKSQGFGETTPVADNKTAAGRAKNRRTEMTVRNY